MTLARHYVPLRTRQKTEPTAVILKREKRQYSQPSQNKQLLTIIVISAFTKGDFAVNLSEKITVALLSAVIIIVSH